LIQVVGKMLQFFSFYSQGGTLKTKIQLFIHMSLDMHYNEDILTILLTKMSHYFAANIMISIQQNYYQKKKYYLKCSKAKKKYYFGNFSFEHSGKKN